MSKLFLPLVGAAALAVSFPQTALAAPDDFCVQQAMGVPGPQPKFPEWWVPGALGKPQRWTGATNRTGNPSASAAPEMANVRSIWDAPSRRLFLHFSVRGDPQLNPEQDMVALALTDATGAPALYIDVRPLLGCVAGETTDIAAVSAGCQAGQAVSGGSPANPVVRYAAATPGGTWGGITPTNPTAGSPFEVVDANHWVEVSESGGLFDWDFKVSLVLPVDGTGQVDPNVRIYSTSFLAFRSGPGIADPVVTFEFPTLCNPDGIAGTCEMDHGSAGPTLPSAVPDTTTRWPPLHTGPGGDCEGIELMRSLVGSDENVVSGFVPGTAVAYPLPGYTINALSGSNLRAGFHNNTSSALSTESIQAEFRIANWGLSYADWDDATWDLVATGILAGSVDPGQYAGAVGQGLIEAPYTAGAVPTNDHQCMHVQLSGVPGSGDTLPFRVDSVYRNMDFVNASVVQRPADIDMSGRALGPGQTDNPVYLVVRTHNMPSAAECEEMSGDLAGCFPVEFKEGGSLDLMSRYTVHGFVDSGRRVNLPDAPQTPILSPFSSYGYYVQHQGEIQGWEHRLDGATPLAPYDAVYRLNVGEGQVATVVDTIRVLDPETPSCTQVTPPVVPDNPGGGVLEAGPGGSPVAPAASGSPMGCDPVQVRPQCTPDDCPPHDPCSYIEHSEYTHPAPAGGDPPPLTPGGTCCLNSNPTKAEQAQGAGGGACLFVVMWGLRRRRRRRT